MTAEVECAWRLLKFNWALLAVLGVAFALAIGFSDFTVELPGLFLCIGFVAVYAAFAHANARSPTRRDPQVIFVLAGTAQIVLVTAIMAPLTYLAAALALPLQDANLLRLDRALGL